MQIYTDGGSRGNPGASACAFVALTDSKVVFKQGKYLGHATNNEAEYQGLIESLLWLKTLPPTNVDFFLDSILVVEQVKGNYRVKKPHLKPLHEQTLALLSQLFPPSTFTIAYVPRAQNSLADALVNQTLDHHPFIAKKS
jgi:ribonuclease HI